MHLCCKEAHPEEENMDKNQIGQVIRRRLKLDDQEWSYIENNPKSQRLFQNALKASSYQLIAEVIESKGCHSGHAGGWGHVVMRMTAEMKP
jgi:hypothetical protein